MLAPGTHGKLSHPLGHAAPTNPVLENDTAEVVEALYETTDGYIYLFKTITGTYKGYEWEFTPDEVSVRTPDERPLREVIGRAKRDLKAIAKSSGYDDEPCPRCGSFKMKRAGACLCCDECGETSGCG